MKKAKKKTAKAPTQTEEKAPEAPKAPEKPKKAADVFSRGKAISQVFFRSPVRVSHKHRAETRITCDAAKYANKVKVYLSSCEKWVLVDDENTVEKPDTVVPVSNVAWIDFKE